MSPSFASSLANRWMSFENAVFRGFLKIEPRIRELPPNVRLLPSTMDRQVFRLLFATTVCLLAIMLAVPSRVWRIRALLVVGSAVLILLAVVLLLDAFPRRRR